MIDLTCTWVTSSSSYVHDDPVDPDPAPQIAAYDRRQSGSSAVDHYDRIAGYFLAATMLCLKFGPLGANGSGTLTGKVRINRGGRKLKAMSGFGGGYTAVNNAAFGITEGTFHTLFVPPSSAPAGSSPIRLDYQYIARSPNELDWIWWESSSPPLGDQFRASVAQGTLRRVLAS